MNLIIHLAAGRSGIKGAGAIVLGFAPKTENVTGDFETDRYAGAVPCMLYGLRLLQG